GGKGPSTALRAVPLPQRAGGGIVSREGAKTRRSNPTRHPSASWGPWSVIQDSVWIPACAGMTGVSRVDLFEQVVPVGVGFLDQLDLPGSFPNLQRLFAGDGFVDAVVMFDVDELVQTISAAEVGSCAVAMLVNDAGDADVQRA